MIYFILSFLLFINSLYYEIFKKKKQKKILMILIIFIFSFSYKMGTDWIEYQAFYENIIPNTRISDLFLSGNFYFYGFEKGFVLVNMFFYNLGFNYEISSGILIAVSLYIIFNFTIKKAENYYISFYTLIVFCLFTVCLEPVLRQLIAMAIVILSFKSLEEKKFLKYCFLIGVATFFHFSAIICLLFYFFNNIQIKQKKFIILFVGSYIFLMILPIVVQKLSNISPIFLKYTNYLFNEKYGSARNRGIVAQSIQVILVLFYSHLIFSGYNFSSLKRNYLKNMGLIYIVINFLGNMLPLIHRFSYYFIVGFAISISAISNLNPMLSKRRMRSKKIFVLIFIYSIFTLLLYKQVYKSPLNIYRYSNYKNYFIELIKGNLDKNFYEKSNEYKRHIDNLIESS